MCSVSNVEMKRALPSEEITTGNVMLSDVLSLFSTLLNNNVTPGKESLTARSVLQANMYAQMDKRNASKGTSQAIKPQQSQGFSFLFVFVIGILGILIGYFMSP